MAVIVRNMLEEKYGRGRVPGVRTVSADIAKANAGETISHGQVFNILDGRVGALTDRTRRLLGSFFGKHPSCFSLVDENDKPGSDPIHVLAARLATFDPAQIDAIRQAIDMVATREGSHETEQ